MATIRVQYRRVIQMKPYETQEIVLGVEEDGGLSAATMSAMQKLYQNLERVGDKLLTDALAKPDLSRPGGGR
mgnify:CR=1 FL=1